MVLIIAQLEEVQKVQLHVNFSKRIIVSCPSWKISHHCEASSSQAMSLSCEVWQSLAPTSEASPSLFWLLLSNTLPRWSKASHHFACTRLWIVNIITDAFCKLSSRSWSSRWYIKPWFADRSTEQGMCWAAFSDPNSAFHVSMHNRTNKHLKL